MKNNKWYDEIDIGKFINLITNNFIVWVFSIIIYIPISFCIIGIVGEAGELQLMVVCLSVCVIGLLLIFAPMIFPKGIVKEGKLVILSKKTRKKNDKIRILKDKCEAIENAIGKDESYVGYYSSLESALFDIRRYFDYIIDDIKNDKEPPYYYIDPIFFAKLKSYTQLKSVVKSMSKETEIKYKEIKEMLINDAKQYYKNMKEKQNRYEYSESEYLVDAVYNVFKESEDIVKTLRINSSGGDTQ